jgi:hypothetical protein
MLCLFALGGCDAEVVELVRYGSDAAQAGDVGTQYDASSDGEVEPLSDAGPSSELDARVRPPFGELDSGVQSRTCGGHDDCAATEYCSLPICTAKRGTCMPSGFMCSANYSPTCGCDGVKYFNDCLRTKQKASADPSCTFIRPCTNTGPTTTTCPLSAAVCSNFFLDRSCRPGQAIRECWVLPTVCPRDIGGDQYVACGAVGTAAESCVNTCEAIKLQAQLGTPFGEVRSCSPPRGTGGPSGMDFM